jgi:hypothetical protein
MAQAAKTCRRLIDSGQGLPLFSGNNLYSKYLIYKQN